MKKNEEDTRAEFDTDNFDFIEKDNFIFEEKNSECVLLHKTTHSQKTQEAHG
ncbi:MAG: hypothetical protein PHP23_04645 [Desulfobacterales bacterium]|nr:hypothetical protein [Desulfobacterales bacterium]MDD4071667.1 hypothetical protein [Desulfobacterales bacterium]MDD4393578.1 hypothetical protein [Desulfobacterales bacterium]